MLELRLGQIVQALGLGVKPLVNLVPVGQGLVDVARLVAQVQHHALTHRLVKLVGVDVAAKHLNALLLVGFQQGRAGKTKKQRIGQQCLHSLVQVATLGAVALIHEHMDVALGHKVSRQVAQGFNELLGAFTVGIVVRLAAKLVHQ